MHTELVEKKKWISESRFLHALNYCMILPGPEAQQLAIYIGWLLHRTWGHRGGRNRSTQIAVVAWGDCCGRRDCSANPASPVWQ